MKLKIICLTALIALIVLINYYIENQKDDIQVIPEKSMIIGVDANFPPFTFNDERGELTGFDIELAKEVMRRMNREFDFKYIEWTDKQNELESKRVDIIWSGLEITNHRKEYMIFTKPYLSSSNIVFMNHHENQINNKSQLAGMTLGVQAGSSTESYIKNDSDLKFKIKALKLYGDYAAAFEDLQNHKIDAVICDEINGRYYIFKNDLKDKIDALNIIIGDMGLVGIGFRKENRSLRDDMQSAFDTMIKDGTARKISEKWFGKNLIIEE